MTRPTHHQRARTIYRILRTGTALVILGSLGVVAPCAAIAQTPETYSNGAIASGAQKLGLGMVVAIKDAAYAQRPPEPLSLDAREAALRKVANGLDRQLARGRSEASMLRAVGDFTSATTGAAVAATGVGAPFAIVAAGAVKAGWDYVAEQQEEATRVAAWNYLAANKAELLGAHGLDIESLRALPPDQRIARIEEASGFFGKLDAELGSSEVGRRFAQEATIETLLSLDQAQLESLEVIGAEVGAVSKELAQTSAQLEAFIDTTNERLDEHAKALTGLQLDVAGLANSAAELDARLAKEERDSAIVNDFVYGQMDPETKLRALERGFLAERFSCPDGGTTCEAAETRRQIVATLKKERDVKQAVQVFGKTAQGLADVVQIAGNLGVDLPPEVAKASNIANVAFGAFTAFSSGNPLGAAVMITGLFRAPVDPDQARFEAMMSFMRESVKRIEQNFQTVFENQQKLMEAIGALSNTIDERFDAVDNRLARIELKLDKTMRLVWGHIRTDALACKVVFEYAQDEGKLSILEDFVSIDHIAAVAPVVEEEARHCRRTIIRQVSAMGDRRYFSNFYSGEYDLAHEKEQLADGDTEVAADDPAREPLSLEVVAATQADMRLFRTRLLEPTTSLVQSLLDARGLTWADALEELAAPVPRLAEAPDRLVAPEQRVPVCSRPIANQRLNRLICGGSSNILGEERARLLLGDPAAVDFVVDFIRWGLVAERVITMWKPTSRTWFTQNTFVEAVLSGDHDPSLISRKMVLDLQLVADYAVAAESLLYGDFTAHAVLHALEVKGEGNPQDPDHVARLERANTARALLADNGYLARNTVLILLRQRYGSIHGQALESTPSRTAYMSALLMAQQTPEDPGILLRTLFGNDLDFVLGPQGQVGLRFDEHLVVDLPGTEAFVEGRLSYPARFIDLLTQRQRIAERLADYDFFRLPELSTEETAYLAGLMSRARPIPESGFTVAGGEQSALLP